MFIMLDEDMNLVITVNDPIYRGDNLSKKITYLIPLTVGEVDVQSADVYLSYIRADGIADMVLLERQDEKYKEAYYQYTLPVNCKLSKYPGEICSWLSICSGTPSCPTIAKSGECTLYVRESKSMDEYLCDHQLTAVYQLHKQMESELAYVDENITQIAEDIASKADGLAYNSETRELQLTSGDTSIGEAVVVPSDDYDDDIRDDVEDEWVDMEDPDDDNGAVWEDM